MHPYEMAATLSSEAKNRASSSAMARCNTVIGQLEREGFIAAAGTIARVDAPKDTTA